MGRKTTYCCDRCKKDGLAQVKTIEGNYIPGGIYSTGYYPTIAELCNECYEVVIEFIKTPPSPVKQDKPVIQKHHWWEWGI